MKKKKIQNNIIVGEFQLGPHRIPMRMLKKDGELFLIATDFFTFVGTKKNSTYYIRGTKTRPALSNHLWRKEYVREVSPFRKVYLIRPEAVEEILANSRSRKLRKIAKDVADYQGPDEGSE